MRREEEPGGGCRGGGKSTLGFIQGGTYLANLPKDLSRKVVRSVVSISSGGARFCEKVEKENGAACAKTTREVSAGHAELKSCFPLSKATPSESVLPQTHLPSYPSRCSRLASDGQPRRGRIRHGGPLPPLSPLRPIPPLSRKASARSHASRPLPSPCAAVLKNGKLPHTPWRSGAKQEDFLFLLS